MSVVYSNPYGDSMSLGRFAAPGLHPGKVRQRHAGLIRLATEATAKPEGLEWLKTITVDVPAGEKISLGELPARAVVTGVWLMADSGGTVNVGDNLVADRYIKNGAADGSLVALNNMAGFGYIAEKQRCLYAVCSAAMAGRLSVVFLYATE